MKLNNKIIEKAKKIKLVLTDCDGVLTDTGVYYSPNGEELKRFSVRDGMGVERLRKLLGIDTGIITGEDSVLVKRRADKLDISQLYLGVKDKVAVLNTILLNEELLPEEIAYIGDDTNDLAIMELVGLSGCPTDATSFAKETADVVVDSFGGYGAFRDFAELIISAKTTEDNVITGSSGNMADLLKNYNN